jgi:hypothetical protein
LPAGSQDFKAFTADVFSKRLEEGYTLSDSWTAHGLVEVGLAGRSVTSVGRVGLDLRLEGWTAIHDRPSAPVRDEARATLRTTVLLQKESETQITFDIAGSRFSGSLPERDEERIGVRLFRHVSFEDSGVAFWPYVAARHTWGRHEGTLLEAGLDHNFSLENKLPLGKSALLVNAHVSGSNDVGLAAGPPRAFGFHEVALQAELQIARPLGSSTLLVTPGLRKSWSAAAVNPDRPFSWGVAVGISR